MCEMNLSLNVMEMRIPFGERGMESSAGRHGTVSADIFILRYKAATLCGTGQIMSE